MLNLETTYNRLRTEKEIEGAVLSPKWYILTITTQQYLYTIKGYFEYTLSLHGDFYKHHVNSLIERKRLFEAAILIQRWMEFSFKLNYAIRDVEKIFIIGSNYKNIHDLPWPSIDFEKIKTEVESCTQEASDALVSLLPSLTTEKLFSDSENPDHFGQALTFGLHGCYEAAKNQNIKRLEKLLPVVFLASLSAFERIKKDVSGWNQDSRIVFSSEPIEDLLTLCGYIKLYSELYDNTELWELCESLWSNYLNTVSNSKEFLEIIIALLKYRESLITIMPRNILRFNWSRSFQSKLEETGLSSDLFAQRDPLIINQNVHPSSLIRIFARDILAAPEKARNAFLTTFLFKRPEAEGFDFRGVTNMSESLERAENSYGETE